MTGAVTFASLIGALLAGVLGRYHWRRRRLSSLSGPLAVTMLCGASWALLQAVVVWTRWEPVRVAAAYAILPAVTVLTAGIVVYTLVLTGHHGRVTRRLLLLLGVHPVLMLLAVAADPWLHLVYRMVGEDADGHFVLELGPVFWLHTAYSYGMVLLSALLMAHALVRAVRGHRAVLALALVATVLPMLGNTVMLVTAGSGTRVDLAPVLFLVTAGIWSWVARFRSRLDVVPISTRDVLAALGDAVVVVDADGVVIDANPRGRELLDRLRPAGDGTGAPLGRSWDEVVDARYLRLLADVDQRLVPLEDGTVLDVRIERMRTPAGLFRGAVVVTRDVTELERLRVELAELAVRDSLTGLFNRRHLGRSLATAVGVAETSGTALSVAMVDVDRFKQVNDSYGHAVGDAVLQQVAQLLSTGVRDEDVLARSGGEEFVVVLPGATGAEAAARADVLRARCGAHTFTTGAGPLHVTVSLGVAEHRPGVTADDLLVQADGALYVAKAEGRDCVRLADVRGAGRR